ncbi:MAG: N(4)-(beta-N-acetylglucosaminyl)-L-asparaginase [Candidatus Aminicenantes bacterium]|nr:N(4)-(beta-N-acetylglucosaminyl)-L-asparaginase [Candidatus Aminicenantes bacterium]
MTNKMSRRNFFSQSFKLGAGTFLAKSMPSFQAGQSGRIPMIISSHWNETGKKAVETGWEILASGGNILDAVEKAANIIELDAEGLGVGYGGLPNEEGIVQLDASIMDGKTYNAGSVAALENIKTPCSVARIVMERTDHVMLVGKDALKFAKKWGFKEEDLLTDKARQIWLKWKENISKDDDWGPPDHIKTIKNNVSTLNSDDDDVERVTGTTNVLAVDTDGNIAGITTTSGLSFKIAGRIGDSPIIGAGLYVDNNVGAAGATGRGEDVIKSCGSYYVVMRMKEGRTPQQACEDAMKMIADKYKSIGSDYLPGEKFVAINKKGEMGCAGMRGSIPPQMSVMTSAGFALHKGTIVFPVKKSF